MRIRKSGKTPKRNVFLLSRKRRKIIFGLGRDRVRMSRLPEFLRRYHGKRCGHSNYYLILRRQPWAPYQLRLCKFCGLFSVVLTDLALQEHVVSYGRDLAWIKVALKYMRNKG